MTVVLLPGLDGTSLMYSEIVALSGAAVIEYPDEPMTYEELAGYVIERMPTHPLLVGESFGGPIATIVASKVAVEALVLSNSFVVPAWPRLLRYAALETVARIEARIGVPEAMLNWWLLSPRATPERTAIAREAIGMASPAVIASRLRLTLSVDVRAQLAATTAPLVDLRGTHDRLVRHRHRRQVLAARPDARTIDVDAPHALLFTAAAQGWEAIRSAHAGGNPPGTLLK